MSMNYVPNRVQAGVPAGGQFTETAHHESGVSLGGSRGDGSMRARAVDFLRGSLQRSAGKAVQSRPGQPVKRRGKAKTRVAVAALVLAASVSLTACGTDKGQACQAAPDFGPSTVATASYNPGAASFSTVAAPLRGGGHGHGHSSHSSGHVSEGGVSSGRSSGGFRWWPWASHSNSDEQCKTDTPASNS